MKSNGFRVSRAHMTGVVLAAIMLLASGPAMALPLYDGINNLAGRGYGLDENYVEPAGPPAGSPWYMMPNGATSAGANAGLGTPGMTETIFTAPRGPATVAGGGAPLGGINLPQPALLSAGSGDRRAGVPNFALPAAGGAPVWGARAGGAFRWETNANFDGSASTALPLGDATAIAYNMTPFNFSATTFGFDESGGLAAAIGIDDGLAPGSAIGDTIPDTIPFLTTAPGGGQRIANFELSFIGLEDFALFGHADAALFAADPIASNMLPIVEIWEGGNTFELSVGGLLEGDFDHDFGANTGEVGDATDGGLLLSGFLTNAIARQSLIETAPGSGVFELDVTFQFDVAWVGGSLVGPKVLAADLTDPTTWTGTGEINWADIPFPTIGPGPYGLAAPGAGEFPNGTFDRNGLSSFDFRPPPGSFSADLNFEVTIPEPVTAGMGLLGLSSLGAYLFGRRRRA